MQDIGPDMKQLLHQASKEYPLKDTGDKWHVIQEAIRQQGVSSGRNRYLSILLPAVLLMLLIFIGLIIGNSDKIPNNKVTIGKNDLARRQVREQIENATIAENKQTLAGSDEKTSAKISVIPSAKMTISQEMKSTDLRVGITDIIHREDIEGLVCSDSLNVNTHPSKTDPAPQLIANRKKNGFYYGVLAGLDANAVKDQPFGISNFELGAIAGFRFSRLLTVESGISLVKKYYRTKAEYFSMDEMSGGMPGGAQMMNVNGNSMIIRIPLHLRTDFINQQKYRLFTSFGVSSYILTEENNQYKIIMNGTEEKMFGSYSKNKNYFAATADVSFGYERTVGGSQIRFQPYLQLPVRGIGVGRLPIKSAGIRVGLTRN